jgi:hypothetical protein
MHFSLSHGTLRLYLRVRLQLLLKVADLLLECLLHLLVILYVLIEHGRLSDELAVLLEHALHALLVHGRLRDLVLYLGLEQHRLLEQVLDLTLILIHFNHQGRVLFLEVVYLGLHTLTHLLRLLGGLPSHELEDASAHMEFGLF